MKTLVLRVLEQELEASGLKQGTEAYMREERARKVGMCKVAQRVSSCWDCQAFDGCSLIKQHLRDLHTPQKPE